MRVERRQCQFSCRSQEREMSVGELTEVFVEPPIEKSGRNPENCSSDLLN